MNWKKHWLNPGVDIPGKSKGLYVVNKFYIIKYLLPYVRIYQYHNHTINISIYKTDFYYNVLVT